ncbi:MAG: hypothetical protein K0R50_230 [Eubacterium sp.]|jgi:hypothetical protein|nr:hypothetical protein [Eubacterium sp.]
MFILNMLLFILIFLFAILVEYILFPTLIGLLVYLPRNGFSTENLTRRTVIIFIVFGIVLRIAGAIYYDQIFIFFKGIM